MLKVYNLLKKTPASVADKRYSEDHLPFGIFDNDPILLADSIYKSNAGNACLETFGEYVYGSGLEDGVSEHKVNTQGQTWGDIHSLCRTDIVMFGGFALNVKYNLLGEITELYHLPFEFCRLSKPDDAGYVSKIFYNPYFGTTDYKQKKDLTQSFDVFNPSKINEQIVSEQGNYKGQVLYTSIDKPLSRLYPDPYWVSAVNWVKIDAKISQFHERNIDNNFLLSVLIKMVGDPDQAIETNSNGEVTKTVGEQFDEEMQGNFSGSENAGKVMVLWSKLKEYFPEIESFPTNSNHDLFIALQQLVIDNLAIGFRVNPILAGIQVSGKLGNSQEITNAVQVMNSKVEPFQKLLEQVYNRINSFMMNKVGEIRIKKNNPVSIIPTEFIDALTLEEKRLFIERNYNIELLPTPTPKQNGV